MKENQNLAMGSRTFTPKEIQSMANSKRGISHVG